MAREEESMGEEKRKEENERERKEEKKGMGKRKGKRRWEVLIAKAEKRRRVAAKR